MNNRNWDSILIRNVNPGLELVHSTDNCLSCDFGYHANLHFIRNWSLVIWETFAYSVSYNNDERKHELY